MNEFKNLLGPDQSSSTVELKKFNKHENEAEINPCETKHSDYNHRLTERVQSDIEKLKDGLIHRHRYKLYESRGENVSQAGNLGSNDRLLSKNNDAIKNDQPSSSKPSNELNSSKLASRVPSNNSLTGSLSRLSHLINNDDDDLTSLGCKIRDYEPIGARLASDLGVDVRCKPVSFNYEQAAKRRAHEALLRQIDDEDEKFRTLPPNEPFRYKAREQMFAHDWDEKDLRYLSREGRQYLIRPTLPAVVPEQSFKHKRKSKYAKFLEQY